MSHVHLVGGARLTYCISSCISRALEGGESDIVSSNHVWNVLQQERPDVAKLLSQPICMLSSCSAKPSIYMADKIFKGISIEKVS